MTASSIPSSSPPAPPVINDAATRAASIQKELDRQELRCSLIALAAKSGLIILGCVSVARMSVAYQERLERHSELAAVVSVESAKLESLQSKFDRLFTVGGEKRLISEQDQWIAPNRVRVIRR